MKVFINLFAKKKSPPLKSFLGTEIGEALIKSEDFYKPAPISTPDFNDELIHMEFENVGTYKPGSLTKRK